MLTGLILAAAALFVPQDKVQVSSAEIRPVAGSESAFQVVVDLEVEIGWHVYHPSQDPALGEPISLSVSGEGIRATGKTSSLSPAKPHMEQIGGQILMYQWLDGAPQLCHPQLALILCQPRLEICPRALRGLERSKTTHVGGSPGCVRSVAVSVSERQSTTERNSEC